MPTETVLRCSRKFMGVKITIDIINGWRGGAMVRCGTYAQEVMNSIPRLAWLRK